MCTDNFTTNETRNAILPANNNPQTDDDFARVLVERDEARAAAVDMRRERDALKAEARELARIARLYDLINVIGDAPYADGDEARAQADDLVRVAEFCNRHGDDAPRNDDAPDLSDIPF